MSALAREIHPNYSRGMDSESGEPLPVRLSDRERDAVVGQLNEAVGDGRISMSEFEVRAKQAYAAKYPADLVPLTGDLPAPVHNPLPVPSMPPSVGGKRRRRWVVSIMGGTDRRGNWDPADAVNTITIMGGSVIDLTQVAASEVTINSFTAMGATEIIVPRGAVVDLGGFILMGGTDNSTTNTGDSTMRVRIRSFGMMGGCEIRHLKPKEEAKRLKRGL